MRSRLDIGPAPGPARPPYRCLVAGRRWPPVYLPRFNNFDLAVDFSAIPCPLNPGRSMRTAKRFVFREVAMELFGSSLATYAQSALGSRVALGPGWRLASTLNLKGGDELLALGIFGLFPCHKSCDFWAIHMPNLIAWASNRDAWEGCINCRPNSPTLFRTRNYATSRRHYATTKQV